MGGARSLLHEEPLRGFRTVGGWRPEFTHHDLAVPIVLQPIKGPRVRAGGLRDDAQSVPPRTFGKPPVVVFSNTVANRLSQVSQKAITDIAIPDNSSSDDRQIWQRIIASPGEKLLSKSFRPIQPASFPAVRLHVA
jgi:hypothetical protein